MGVTLREAVRAHVEVKMLKNQSCTDEVKECLIDKVCEGIEKDIKECCRPILEKEIKKQMYEKQEKERIKQIKVFLLETVIFGGLIGLLVNQGTELISALKGAEINIPLTLVWVLILIGLTALFAFTMYIDKMNELFSFKSDKQENEE